MAYEKRQYEWKYWLFWVIANTAGWGILLLVGGVVGYVVYKIEDSLPFIDPRLRVD